MTNTITISTFKAAISNPVNIGPMLMAIHLMDSVCPFGTRNEAEHFDAWEDITSSRQEITARHLLGFLNYMQIVKEDGYFEGDKRLNLLLRVEEKAQEALANFETGDVCQLCGSQLYVGDQMVGNEICYECDDIFEE